MYKEINKADIRDGNEYIIRKWLVLKFHGSGHLQILIHLNKITECLKMTTFKIVSGKNPSGCWLVQPINQMSDISAFVNIDKTNIT
jgi:hypothetical protein